MKINIVTRCNNAIIEQTVSSDDDAPEMKTYFNTITRVFKVQDEQFVDALKAIGWTPPRFEMPQVNRLAEPWVKHYMAMAEGSVFMGHDLKDLSRDELLAIVIFQEERSRFDQSLHMHDLDVLGSLRK